MSFSYVVFCKADCKHILTPFIHKEINHCYLLIPDGNGWISCDKILKEVEIYTINDISDILSKSKLIKVKAIKGRRSIFMLSTCVGYVKQYLGIRNPFILTPYQLYRSLTHGTQ